MKVLEVVGICGGGLARHVQSLTERLISEGHDVTVTYSAHGIDPAFRTFAAERQGDVDFVPLEVRREISPASDFKNVVELLRIIRTTGPYHVVHGHSAKGGRWHVSPAAYPAYPLSTHRTG